MLKAIIRFITNSDRLFDLLFEIIAELKRRGVLTTARLNDLLGRCESELKDVQRKVGK